MTQKEIYEALEFCIEMMTQFNKGLDAMEEACQARMDAEKLAA